MSGNGKAPDAIDAAIAAAEAPQSVVMKQIPVTISSTGRPAAVIVPADASEAELVELAGWFLVQVIPGFRAEREKGAASRLVVPSGVRIGRPA
jgi:prevent-host-death family protein